jgi:hypothetical protein
MDASQRVDSFHFHDNAIFDEQVEAIADSESQALVDDRQFNLPSEGDAADAKLMREAVLVGGFQKAWTERFVDFEAGVEDGPGQGLHFGRQTFVSFVFFVSFVLHEIAPDFIECASRKCPFDSAGYGVDGSGFRWPFQRATMTEATALPKTLVELRPMSMMWSTASTSGTPAMGRWK